MGHDGCENEPASGIRGVGVSEATNQIMWASAVQVPRRIDFSRLQVPGTR
jgi:hypothetical protein